MLSSLIKQVKQVTAVATSAAAPSAPQEPKVALDLTPIVAKLSTAVNNIFLQPEDTGFEQRVYAREFEGKRNLDRLDQRIQISDKLTKDTVAAWEVHSTIHTQPLSECNASLRSSVSKLQACLSESEVEQRKKGWLQKLEEQSKNIEAKKDKFTKEILYTEQDKIDKHFEQQQQLLRERYGL